MRWLLLLVLLGSPLCNGQELVWGYFDFPPLIYFDKEQQITKGMAVGLLKQIEAQTKYTFRLRRYPMQRLTLAIENGQAVTMASSKIDSLLPLGHFTANPVFAITAVVLSDDVMPVRIAGMRGSLGFVRGYHFGGVLENFKANNPLLTTTRRNTHLSLIKSLRAGRIDYAFNYLVPAQSAARSIGYSTMRYTIINRLQVYFFASNSVDNALEIVQKVDKLIPGFRYQWAPWADEPKSTKPQK